MRLVGLVTLLISTSCVHHHHHGHAHVPASEMSQVEGELSSGRVISHSELKEYGNDGTVLVGLATRSLGAQTFEIWRSQVPPGGATPKHVHSSEEIFVVLRGQGEVHIGNQVIPFVAPATVIAPAGVPHLLKNTGNEPTDQIVVIAIDSEIESEKGEVMNLPWRK